MIKALRKKTGSSAGPSGISGWSAENRAKSSSYSDDVDSFGELHQEQILTGGGRGGAIDQMNIPDSKPSASTELHHLVLSHDWDEMRSMLGFVDDVMSNPSSQGENDVPNGPTIGSSGNNTRIVKGLKKKGLKARRGGASSSADGSNSTLTKDHCLSRDESGRTP